MTSPIQLALIITELEVGGAERCLVNLATGLDRNEFQVRVYSLAPRPAAGKDSLVRQLESAGVPVEFLNLQSIMQFPWAFTRLQRSLEKFRPQIVQTFLFHANIVGALAARKARVPYLVTGVRVADPRRWRARVEQWFARGINKIVCVSESVAEYCRRHDFPAHKLVVIPNGVDLSQFQNVAPADLSALGVPLGKRTLLYVGRLDRQKGLDDLLRAMPVVFAQLPEHQLLLVGDGPQRSELQRLTAKLNLRDRVHFAGYREDVPAIMAASELIVLPSRWEGMPNVVLEAMASAKAVVASRAEGVYEVLGDAAQQQTYEPGDTAGLVRILVQFAQNPQLASDMANSNHQRAADFDLSKMVERCAALYRGLVAGAPQKNLAEA